MLRSFMPFWLRQNQSMAFAVLIAAIAAALFAPSVFVRKPVPAAVMAPPPAPPVMVAARPIPAGAVLQAQDLTPRPGAGTAPAGSFTSADPLIGRVSAKSLRAGNTLLAQDLRDAATLGISGKLAEGQRAFSIRITEDEIVGGFLQSGDQVDILVVVPGTVFPAKSASDVSDRSRAVVLLQNISVIAVGENLASNGTTQPTARTVSLSLTPDQASRLILAQRFGKVAIAIRRPGDDAISESAPVTLDDIVPPSSTPAPKTRTAQVSRTKGVPFFAGTRAGVAAWSNP